MTSTLHNRKVRLVIASLLAVAALVLATVAPRPVSNVDLGNEWQCSKAAFVTTCRPLS
ncbi:hypothetical protein H8A99_42170 [Bradyrhizobium sp. Arg68]|uniref:hypothetical protein n=1 Tax=Bradyrhizobium ivorense TaxID=2511166 RepID=UPI001E48CF2E|nr:hypothetical protein [Bradyrhizobium ivorense]MCC8942845.1 hypothetical protein [Bradyrhizobium ivorense]